MFEKKKKKKKKKIYGIKKDKITFFLITKSI